MRGNILRLMILVSIHIQSELKKTKSCEILRLAPANGKLTWLAGNLPFPIGNTFQGRITYPTDMWKRKIILKHTLGICYPLVNYHSNGNPTFLIGDTSTHG